MSHTHAYTEEASQVLPACGARVLSPWEGGGIVGATKHARAPVQISWSRVWVGGNAYAGNGWERADEVRPAAAIMAKIKEGLGGDRGTNRPQAAQAASPPPRRAHMERGYI